MGVFFDLADEVEGLGGGAVGGLGATDDLDEGHLVDGGEEVDADEVRGVRRGAREVCDRQGGSVGGEDCVGRQMFLRAGGGFGLDSRVLEDGLDGHVATRESGIVGGGGDAGEGLGLLLRRELLSLHALVEQRLGGGAALVGGGLVAVEEHDLDPGGGGGMGDARAHHARAEDAEAADGLVGGVGAGGPLFERLLVEKQRADHRAG